jgi:hypothetical protein
VYPQRSSTERVTKPQAKPAFARRVAALLACGVVARRVTERCGYAPLLAPSHKPKALQQTVFYPTVWSVRQPHCAARERQEKANAPHILARAFRWDDLEID